MNEAETIKLIDKQLRLICKYYNYDATMLTRIESHEQGRNIVYRCVKPGESAKYLRISYFPDRDEEDLQSELEYVRYLSEHGAKVANVCDSRYGNLLEKVVLQNRTFYLSCFMEALGSSLAEHSYQYIKGAPISEYFYNCGKTLGKIHQLSKDYVPKNPRYDYTSRFNSELLDRFVPASCAVLKEKMSALLSTLSHLPRSRDTYGMVHFDYSDGNYMIDYTDGTITVFDFDDCCYCWYLYDLANLWVHGTGWTQFEPDAKKRRLFMDNYMTVVLDGYRSETNIKQEELDHLPLFIDFVLLENLMDEFLHEKQDGEEFEPDEELSFRIKCAEEGIPYYGFFDGIYSADAPFTYND